MSAVANRVTFHAPEADEVDPVTDADVALMRLSWEIAQWAIERSGDDAVSPTKQTAKVFERLRETILVGLDD